MHEVQGSPIMDLHCSEVLNIVIQSMACTVPVSRAL